jgi:hypothetical protein
MRAISKIAMTAASIGVVVFLILAVFFSIFVQNKACTASPFQAQNQSTPISPPLRSISHMVYDSESHRIVLFGGDSTHGQLLADTWIYDTINNSWQNMNPTSHPSGRAVAGMAYDSKASRVILFGGANPYLPFTSVRLLGDTWIYDLRTNVWTEMTPSISPSPRWGPLLAYDARIDRTILFSGGGFAGSAEAVYNDTWMYDLNNNTWTPITMAIAPPPVADGVLAYDSESDRVVMFGGESNPFADTSYDGTWVLDPVNETWTNMAPLKKPSPRCGCGGVYDSVTDNVLLFGGFSGTSGNAILGMQDTWAYNLNSNTWTEISTLSKPSLRSEVAMAYDERADRTVIFSSFAAGGPHENIGNNETWVFDHVNSTWTMVLRGAVDPTIQITYPIDGATLGSPNVTLSGTAADDVEVQWVEVSLDNITWNDASGRIAWTATVVLSEGANTIYVRATDWQGNSVIKAIHVNVETTASSELPSWTWIIALVVVVAIVAVAYLIMRGGRTGH